LSTDTKVLQIISNETRASIDSMSIVTPSVYASIFSQYALEHGETLENESIIAHDIMQMECSNLTSLQAQTSNNAVQLSNSTTKAINAIQTKDEALLAEVLQETQNLKAEIEKLKEAVYKDELTHAYNRKWLHDTYLEGSNQSFIDNGVLVIIDLNFFKQVNDTHGHIIGDKVLIFIANELKKSQQKVVRYGGDEFILIFKSTTTLKNALKLLDNIREDVINKKLKAHGTMFKTSFSYGGVSFKKGDLFSFTVEAADKKMYEDKIEIKKRVTGI